MISGKRSSFVYSKHVSAKSTPQSEPVVGKNMAKNNAGGFVFKIDEWTRLNRFLIIGSEGGTYYVKEKTLTLDNAECVAKCIRIDGPRVVDTIVAISTDGRAPKNTPALFALAMCASYGDKETRRKAFGSLSKVARIGTHLFNFAQYLEGFRGWGRLPKSAVANWYLDMEIGKLVYQSVKYRQRDGWSHRDLLRLSHPKTDDVQKNIVFKWITNPDKLTKSEISAIEGNINLSVISGFNKIQSLAEDTSASPLKTDIASEAVKLIRKHDLPRECVPTNFLKEAKIWKVLLEKMPMTAMIRNLGNMTKCGLISGNTSDAAKKICEELRKKEIIQKSRIHPIQILAALITYSSGEGARGSGQWNPSSKIVDALNDAFHMSFKNIEPTGKNIMLAIDVSGSMTWDYVNGIPGLYPRNVAAAMAMTVAKVEENYEIMAFSHLKGNDWNTYSISPVAISPKMRLDAVTNAINEIPAGGTDCAIPMIYARENKMKIDAFVIYTDNETWCGNIHPFQALQQYRNEMGIPAKLIVAAMTANDFSIADPNDAGMLDICGFDTATPQIISNFIKNKI